MGKTPSRPIISKKGNTEEVKLTDEEVAKLRWKQRKEERKKRPRELTPRQTVMKRKLQKERKKRDKIIASRISQKTLFKRNQLKEDDKVFAMAREERPKESKNNIIFDWDHKTGSFNFQKTLDHYKSGGVLYPELRSTTSNNQLQAPLIPAFQEKTPILETLHFRELEILEQILKTEKHYIPCKPSRFAFIVFPVLMVSFYTIFWVHWLLSTTPGSKQRRVHMLEYLIIEVCGILLIVMFIFLRRLKWVGVLETRQKSFEKRIQYFNLNRSFSMETGNGGDRNGLEEFFAGRFAEMQGNGVTQSCWVGKVGKYGSFIVFEVLTQFLHSGSKHVLGPPSYIQRPNLSQNDPNQQ